MSFFKGFIDELMKLSAYEPWGMGGEWNSYTGSEYDNDSPLMHEKGEPHDVTWKNFRQQHFMNMRTSPDEGKISPGKLGKGQQDGQRR